MEPLGDDVLETARAVIKETLAQMNAELYKIGSESIPTCAMKG
jgi:hypothetical protein